MQRAIADDHVSVSYPQCPRALAFAPRTFSVFMGLMEMLMLISWLQLVMLELREHGGAAMRFVV
ncbi:hypothetical protein [Thermogemmatispora sp.]|uniref:hypothetical protein n=1 Tax=Thermogemmatispora sp. TaxID=1968838 RepID=UPI0035E44001